MTETPKSAETIVAEANALARDFYGLHGCQVVEGYRFDQAHHPMERQMWSLSVAAFVSLRGTDPEDALAEMDD